MPSLRSGYARNKELETVGRLLCEDCYGVYLMLTTEKGK